VTDWADAHPARVFGCGKAVSHDRPRCRLTTVSQPAAARVLVGTSGYNYPEWRGTFYPEKFSTAKMLAYYAERFSTVEINYTFYRIPTEKLLAGWAAGTPDAFQFTLKAPRRITHDAKLQRCEDLVQGFCRTARTLGPKLGTLLFQLPPTFKKDVAVLRAFVDLLPDGTRAAVEFRHPSWLDSETYDVLRAKNVALCVADSEKLSTPIEVTADYAYFRLRDEGYQQADLEKWAAAVKGLVGVRDAFVYFKHEEQGLGPEFARRFIEAL
jgi:uncharacterized protein YecE (DUF72 family)